MADLGYTEIMNKVALLGLAALALSSVGCAHVELGTTYDILIDRQMTPEQQLAAVDAGYAWQKKVPELKLTFTVTDCGDFAGNLLHSVCFHSASGRPQDSDGNPVVGHTNHSDSDDRADVTFYPDNTTDIGSDGKVIQGFDLPTELLNVATHELGHALAHRGDHIAAGNLMAPVTSGQQVIGITASDVAYFWSDR